MLKKVKPMLSVAMTMPWLLGLLVLFFWIPRDITANTGRTITDMVGRQVRLPGKINKIVTTFKPVTLCLLSLGLQDKIIGIDSHSKRDKLTLAVFPEVVNIKGVGCKSTGLNFESIASLKPDLVVLYAQKDGRFLAERLELMGIPALIILPESFDSIKKSIEIMAQAIGEPEKAKRVEDLKFHRF